MANIVPLFTGQFGPVYRTFIKAAVRFRKKGGKFKRAVFTNERTNDDVTRPGGREPRNEINSGRKHRVNNVKRRFNVSPLESSSAKFHRAKLSRWIRIEIMKAANGIRANANTN